jgi:hypothetical protein
MYQHPLLADTIAMIPLDLNIVHRHDRAQHAPGHNLRGPVHRLDAFADAQLCRFHPHLTVHAPERVCSCHADWLRFVLDPQLVHQGAEVLECRGHHAPRARLNRRTRLNAHHSRRILHAHLGHVQVDRHTHHRLVLSHPALRLE